MDGVDRDAIIDQCARVAMDMPLKNDGYHAYRWNDTAKAIAWDIAHAILSLKEPKP